MSEGHLVRHQNDVQPVVGQGGWRCVTGDSVTDRAALTVHRASSTAAMDWLIPHSHGQEMIHACRLLPMISTNPTSSHSTPSTSHITAPLRKAPRNQLVSVGNIAFWA